MRERPFGSNVNCAHGLQHREHRYGYPRTCRAHERADSPSVRRKRATPRYWADGNTDVDLNVRDLSMSAGSRAPRLPRAVSNIAALLRRRETQVLFCPPAEAAMSNVSYQTFARSLATMAHGGIRAMHVV
jgi:hypothetical protein